MIFSDESSFCLGMHDGCTRTEDERPVHRIVGVMVWGCIIYGSRSSLPFGIHLKHFDILAAYREISTTPCPSFSPADGNPLSQRGARPQVARVSLNFFQEANVNVMLCTARSPDFSPIEHYWDMMGRRLRDLSNPLQTV